MPSLLVQAKVAIARTLCHAVVGKVLARLHRGETRSRGCWIRSDGAVLSDSSRAALFWGFYESAEIRYVQRFLRSDLDVIELGASLGVVSSHIARKVGIGHRLLCVEANAALHAEIASNTARNAPGTPVQVVHAAIDYSHPERDTIGFAVAEQNIDSRIAVGGEQGSIQVPRLTLGDLVRRYRLENFTLVSDIEGAEVGFVFEDQESLRRCKQMLIELHEAWFKGHRVGVESMREELERQGFVLKDRRGPVCVFERP